MKPLLRFLACLVASASAPTAAEMVTLTGRAMGTTWSAKFIPPTPPAAPLDSTAVSAHLSARLEALEAIFSTYRPASELARFNAAATTDWQTVSPELARVAHASRELSALTGGAFDATVAPLVALWGFGPQRRPAGTLPTATEIVTARARVDYRRLEIRLSPPALRKTDASAAADFSSMAKGFASDELSALLTSLGAPHHLVRVGGDLRTSGSAPGTGVPPVGSLAPLAHRGWTAAIASPAHTPSVSSSLAATVALSGQALSTSGDAHNAYTVAGERYGHLIDPRTGHPATGPLASVSVIAPTCAQSSALATALFVLGADAGYRFAFEHNLAALFLLRSGTDTPPTHRPTPAFTPFIAPAAPALPLTAPAAR